MTGTVPLREDLSKEAKGPWKDGPPSGLSALPGEHPLAACVMGYAAARLAGHAEFKAS